MYIRVNAVTFSWIGADLVGKAIDDKTQKRIKERMPQGRFGKPEEVAGVVVLLSYPAASHVTGSILTVDSGY